MAWLSPAAVESNQGATFKSHVELVDGEILVQGQPRLLFAGMTGKAEIVIGNRSLLEYVFEPLRQLKDNFSDVPAQISKR